MSLKRPGEMTIIASTINAHKYIEILDNFLVPSIENWSGDDEVIFQDANTSCHRAKGIKTFLQESQIKINDTASEQSRSKSS